MHGKGSPEAMARIGRLAWVDLVSIAVETEDLLEPAREWYVDAQGHLRRWDRDAAVKRERVQLSKPNAVPAVFVALTRVIRPGVNRDHCAGCRQGYT